jgi:hypothetical protein
MRPDHDAVLVEDANFEVAVGDHDGYVLARDGAHQTLLWVVVICVAVTVAGDARDDPARVFLKRSYARASSAQRCASSGWPHVWKVSAAARKCSRARAGRAGPRR